MVLAGGGESEAIADWNIVRERQRERETEERVMRFRRFLVTSDGLGGDFT